ncbi:hypothetical protein NDU88_001784 [Pleurodeles waltl]|uniref:Uncharacterized protein n=1 Tax=Pleurodeles waltl TaxID=8319 RepID=A0AAV7T0X3_PLEWA|nr:hypothetical protein NDU88_001784 [Pleurodeles waltl]
MWNIRGVRVRQAGLPCPAAQILPPFTAVGAPPVKDPQSPHLLGDGTPNTLLLMGTDLQKKTVEKEDEPGDGCVAAVEPVDSDEEEAEEENVDNRTTLIEQYFQ